MTGERTALGLALCSVFWAVTASADELSVAREALRDGLWDVARTHAEKETVQTNEAKLVILESLAGAGRWNEIRARLDAWRTVKGDGFDYYRAIVAGDRAAAAKILEKGGSPEGLIEARLYEADSLAKAGERTKAEEVWRKVASATNLGERALATVGINLKDKALLQRAYETVADARIRRRVALNLGCVMLKDAATAAEGKKMIRSVVKDSPDAEGAREAFLAMADAEISAEKWKTAYDILCETVEIWPDAAKLGQVNEQLGWTLLKLGKREDALASFVLAEECAADYDAKAVAILKQGDVLSEMGRDEEAMARYRTVLGKFPKSIVAQPLQRMVEVRERENRARALYKAYDFDAASKLFAAVGRADSDRKPRMDFYQVLCLYGQGLDDEACRRAGELAESCPDPIVRSQVRLWLAKFEFNRRNWKRAVAHFRSVADATEGEAAAEALLWAARAAFADNDFTQAIQLTTRLIDRHADSPLKSQALLVQGETLMEQSRFDEAVLILERVILADDTRADDRARAQMLKADALFALGADNSARYSAALEAYNALLFGGNLSPSGTLVVSFKIARVLEKLKRLDEAIDRYYVHVVLAYRTGRARHERYDEEARAVFSRAAFRLADEYESRGKDFQAVAVLRLVADSDVPAAVEADKRIHRITTKGRFL